MPSAAFPAPGARTCAAATAVPGPDVSRARAVQWQGTPGEEKTSQKRVTLDVARFRFKTAAPPPTHTISEGASIMIERTLSIIKPDGVSRGIVGDVVARLEKNALTITAMKMIHMTRQQAEGFYAVHRGKPFFESLTTFMSSGPSIVMTLEGENAITRYRDLMGATDYRKAAPGTIRADFATDIEKNVVHGSDAPETAAFEIGYFFSALEIVR
jgi:nucleoside-diphosphate kinase